MGNKLRQIDLATNDLGRTAWGIPKVALDFSLLSAMFTYNVPNRVWYQEIDTGAGYVENGVIDTTYATSTHGHLEVIGTAGVDSYLRTKRHPRYQPNRGLIIPTALILPNPDDVGNRFFGHGTHQNAWFFKLVGGGGSHELFVVRRTTIGGATTEYPVSLDAFLPAGFDISKGHTYDIQEEWRGIGNVYVYVDLQLVHAFELLGTLTELSVANPALPPFFEVTGALAPLSILVGCVDVTSEGGHRANKQYTSASTDKVPMATVNGGKAALAVRIPKYITYDGQADTLYTRDMILTELSTFCKDEAYRSVHFGRLVSTPNLDGMTNWVTAPDSFYEYATNELLDELDIAFQLDKGNINNIYTTRNEKDFSSSHNNPDPDHADFHITPGDIIVVEFDSDGNSTAGATLEFAELV